MTVLRTGMVALFGVGMSLGLLGTPAGAESRVIKLSGLDEVPVVMTTGSGRLEVKIPNDGSEIAYTLSYQDIEGGDVTQAHIHLGQKHTTGNIVVFLCTNLGNAPVSATNPTPACPASPDSVSGTLDASNVIDRSAQGVGAGDLAAVIEAIRRGVAYGNVHTTVSPSGEIRGQFHGRH